MDSLPDMSGQVVTWSYLLEAYLRASPELAVHTVRTYRSVLKPLIEFWGPLSVDDFDLDDADQFRELRCEQVTVRKELAKAECADDTLRRAKTLVAFGVDRRKLDPRHPLLGMRKFRRYKGREIALTVEQMEAILSVEFPSNFGADATKKFRALAMAMWSSTARINEILKNRWENFDGRVLYVPAAISKNRKPCLRAMSEDAGRELSALYDGTSPWLFPAKTIDKHMHYTQAREWFVHAFNAAGLEGTSHTIRHTGATDLVFAGVDVESVKRVLGHSHLGTTMTYIHPHKPMLLAWADQLAAHREATKRTGPRRAKRVPWAHLLKSCG